MVPVVVRETEHLPISLFPGRGRSQMRAAGEALPSALRVVSAAPHAVPAGVDRDRVRVPLRAAGRHAGVTHRASASSSSSSLAPAALDA